MSVSIGAPLLGTMEGCYFPRQFEKTNFFIYGKFYEEFERYVREKENMYLGSSSVDPEDIKT